MSSPLDPYIPGSRVPALDGVRAVAVVAVVALHAQMFSWGWIGVDAFFVLSGFLITGILLDARAAGASGWVGYGTSFYMRRLVRIAPLAWAFLAVLFILLPALGLVDRVPVGEQLWYWGFVSNVRLGLRSSTAWMAGHFWSLAVEEQFYLVWPWLVLMTPRRHLGKVLGALLLVAFGARVVLAALPLSPQVGHAYENLLISRMDGLLAGSLVALIARDGKGLIARRRGSIVLLLACGIMFVSLQLLAATKLFGFVLRYSMLAGMLGSALLLLLSAPDSAVSRLLGQRWLRWIGTRSYGVYVIHLPVVLLFARRGLAPAVVLGAGLAITVALAALSWVLLERPLLAYKERWPMTAGSQRDLTKRREPAAAPAPSY